MVAVLPMREYTGTEPMRFAAAAAVLFIGRMTATDRPDRRLCIKKRFLLLTEAEGVFFF